MRDALAFASGLIGLMACVCACITSLNRWVSYGDWWPALVAGLFAIGVFNLLICSQFTKDIEAPPHSRTAA